MECASCHSELPDGSAFCPLCGGRQAGVAEPDGYRYAAFISYRHLPRDQEVAIAVQRAIETYRFPRGVSPAWGAAGARSLGKAFRDKDELGAEHSLPDRIRDALAASHALVVVCTPDTPDSIWVEREVREFARLHGRERIFAVLAAGRSAESIPPLLRERLAAGPDGIARPRPAEPLAADLRPESAGHAASEKLRIIASVAGCSFDDLRQRQRARRRKRIAATTLAALAIAGIIGASALQAAGSSRQALADESARLAAESQRLLEQGDRYGAIEAALDALPASGADLGRPLVPAAQEALEQALEVNPDPSHVWRPSYAVDADGDIVALAASPSEGWFAIMDSSCGIAVHDTLTGRMLARCELPAPGGGEPSEPDSDPANWAIVAAGTHLVAVERDGSGIIACFDAATGSLAWSIESARSDAVTVSADGSTFGIFSDGGDELYAVVIDVATGEPLRACRVQSPGLPSFPIFLPACMDDAAETLYVGIGSIVARFDIATAGYAATDWREGEVIWSIACIDGMVVAASSTLPDATTAFATYRVDGYNPSLEKAWSAEGNWGIEGVGWGYDVQAVDSWPAVYPEVDLGQPAVVCSAGRTVRAFVPETGEELCSESLSAPIVGIGSGYVDGPGGVLFVACADGMVACRGLVQSSPVARGLSGLGFDFPQTVGDASVAWTADSDYVALGRPLNDPGRVVAYHIDADLSGPDAQAESHTLDELIELAHDQLSTAGR